jgi:hypothetical protein
LQWASILLIANKGNLFLRLFWGWRHELPLRGWLTWRAAGSSWWNPQTNSVMRVSC